MTTATATKPATTRKTNLGPKVDQLGALNAQIAALTKEADALKKLLKDSGQSEICGKAYKAVIASSTRTTLVAEKVRSLLTDLEIALCTQTTNSKTLTMYGL